MAGELVITFNPHDAVNSDTDDGLEVLDGARIENAINGSSGGFQDGDETYIITYDLRLDNDNDGPNSSVDADNVNQDVIVGTTQTNTATIDQYFAEDDEYVDDGDNDPSDPVRQNRGGDSDTADVTTREPTLEKILINTGITTEADADYDNDLLDFGGADDVDDNGLNDGREAVIGELVLYEVTVTFPEGVTPNARIIDFLDEGLAIHHIVSVEASDGLSTDLFTTAADFALLADADDGDPETGSFSHHPSVTYNHQPDARSSLIIELGDVYNDQDDDDDPETIVIQYYAVVENLDQFNNSNQRVNQSTNEQDGPQLNNGARLFWDNADGERQRTANSRADTIKVIEPVNSRYLKMYKLWAKADPVNTKLPMKTTL